MDRKNNRTFPLTVMGVLLLFTVTLATPVKSKRAGSLMFDYNWPEPDPNVNHIPHEKSCHHYYLVLSPDDISVEKCPDGQLFDYVIHTCSPKEIARCWSHHFEKKIHNHPMRKHFRCPYTWGKYPDIHDCRKYYSCISSKPKHKKCAPYEKFDKILGKCVGEIYALCADESDVIEHGYVCPKAWGSFVSSKNCSKYYECLERKPTLRTCPQDTLFHEHKRRCVPKDHVKCGLRHNPHENVVVMSFQPKISTLNPNERSTSKLVVGDVSTPISSKSTDKQGEQQPATTIIRQIKNNQNELNSGSEIPPISTTNPEMEVKESTRIKSKETNVNEVQETTRISEMPGQELTIINQHSVSVSEVQKASTSMVETAEPKLSTYFEIKDNLGMATTYGSSVEKDSKKNTNIRPEISVVSTNMNEFIEVSASPKSQAKKFSDVTDVSPSTTNYPETANDSSSKAKGIMSQSSTALPSNTEEVTVEKCSTGDVTCSTDKTGGAIRCPSAASGLFPHPRDESRYLRCENYKIQVLTCPTGHIYYTHEKKCDSAVILFR